MVSASVCARFIIKRNETTWCMLIAEQMSPEAPLYRQLNCTEIILVHTTHLLGNQTEILAQLR